MSLLRITTRTNRCGRRDCCTKLVLLLLIICSLAAEFVSEKASEDVQKLFQDFVKANEKDNKCTGVLYTLNGSAMLCLVESSTKVLLNLLHLLQRPANSKLLRWTRVCSLAEEVPREFRVWAFRAHRAADEEDFQPPKDWLRLVFSTLKGLLELGREVASMADEKTQEAFLSTNKSAQVMMRIPSLARVRSFGSCPEMCTVDEYVEMFDTPVEFTLGLLFCFCVVIGVLFAESERVWPVEPPVKVCLAFRMLFTMIVQY